MCTSPDYAAMKEAMKAAKDVDQYDTMLQRLQDGESITLPTTYSPKVPRLPAGSQRFGAYLTLYNPNCMPDKVDIISEKIDNNLSGPEKAPIIAVKKAVKALTIDDKF